MNKNILLCISLFIFNSAQANDIDSTETTFTPQVCTFTYTIKAKDAAQLDDIKQLHTRLNDLTHRNTNPTVYQSLVVFMKELQEAIAAGFNLFITATTQNEPLAQVLEEAIVDAITQNEIVTPAEVTNESIIKSTETTTPEAMQVTSDEIVEEQAANSDNVAIEQNTETEATEQTTEDEVATTENTEDTIITECNNEAVSENAFIITFSIAGIANNAHELEVWNEIKELLSFLAQSTNSQTLTEDELSSTVNKVQDLLAILTPEAPALEVDQLEADQQA